MLPIKIIGSIPMEDSSVLIIPDFEKISAIILPRITQEIKLGRYTIVCSVLFKSLHLTALSISANTSGTSRFSSILDTAITRVFTKICLLSGSWNMNLKLSSPTHLEPRSPLAGRKFWNAIIRPPKGIILKISIKIMPGAIIA